MNNHGPIILFGSGENSPTGRKSWDWLFSRSDAQPNVAILETPAGFEPNSAAVAGDVADFLTHRLQNYDPQITIIPARKRETTFSPDDLSLLQPMLAANILFMGAGSPTYAVRQLQESAAYHLLRAKQRRGAAVVLASASGIAASRFAMPVYEIYKVGEELHWKRGLDLLGDYGLSLVIVPHWNNRDGGDKLDTSRCYLGQARFNAMRTMLPPAQTVVGIDEHTALVVDIDAAQCHVLGQGQATIIRNDGARYFDNGSHFPIDELGPFHLPENDDDIPAEIWQLVQQAQSEDAAEPTPSDLVLTLVAERSEARQQRQWQRADDLRDQIEQMGWLVQDGAAGPQLTSLQ